MIQSNSIKSMPRSNSNKIKIKKVHRPTTSKSIFQNNNKYRNLGRNDKMEKNSIFNDLEYNNLYYLSTKLLEQKNNLFPESTRTKPKFLNKNEIKIYNNSDQKKIKIDHEVLSSLSSTNEKNRTNFEKNINSNNNEKIMKENEELKKDNQAIKKELQKLIQKMEENEKFKKKLEDKFFSSNEEIQILKRKNEKE